MLEILRWTRASLDYYERASVRGQECAYLRVQCTTHVAGLVAQDVFLDLASCTPGQVSLCHFA